MKLRLLVWIAVLAAAVVLLLHGAAWPGADDPATAVMAVIQVAAGLLALWLLVATIVSLIAAVTWHRAIGPAIVRRVVAAAVGGGLLIAPMAASAATAPPAGVEAPVLRRVPGDSAPAPAPAPTATPVASTAAESTVTAVPGDHLWAIATRTVAERLGRAPTDAEIVPYWTRLIDANRDRLATGDPDLIFVGQVFRLPS
jgi:nucleoid-associated protein YgaU